MTVGLGLMEEFARIMQGGRFFRHRGLVASESLGSASEMLSNFAAILEPAHRKTALGIAQVVMVAGLAVNQALDKVERKA